MVSRPAAPLSYVASIVIILVLWGVVFGLIVSPYLIDMPVQTATADDVIVWVPSDTPPPLP